MEGFADFLRKRGFGKFFCHLFASFPDLLIDMITTNAMKTVDSSDADLVTQSLAGDCDAFGKIVTRHQSLLCSLAYSATGSLNQSEDLAQETFVAAWKQLSGLREPEKLRSWLCRILRNLACDALRKQGREPSHCAASLEEISESRSPEPLPLEHTISNEEQQILWRSIERIPEIYREPLVLFYREHQSIEAVAQGLELSVDVVKQRLSRGRKMLHVQILALVEGTLERTNPGKAFTLAVLASLPGFTISAKAATGGAIATGGVATKATGILGFLNAILGLLVIFVPNYIGYRIGLAGASSEEEREHIKALYRKISTVTLALFLPFTLALLWISRNQNDHSFPVGLFAAVLTLIFLPVFFAFCVTTAHRSRDYYSKVLERDYNGVFPRPMWEYRSKASLFGLPLVHIRVGDRFACLKKPVKAWIAAGNSAIGGLFAFGGLAIAPLSVGGLAIGFLSLGGLSIAIFALGGMALGVWVLFGGLIVGWQAFGGAIAIGWNAAVGYVALAHGYALGHIARAAQFNNAVARNVLEPNLALRCAQFVNEHWLWLNLLWIVPFFIQWRIIARHRSRQIKRTT